MKTNSKRRLLDILGLCLCTIPPAVTALFYFPLWIGKRESAVSVLGILVLCLCAIPFWRYLKEALKSPSAFAMWTILFLALTLFESLCEGLRVVSLVGIPSSFAGALCFHFGKRIGEKDGK